jgi:methylated-DNA-[protein]-cysteine S-methyltransferase
MIALLRMPAGPALGLSHGWVCLGATDRGIAACTLPQPTAAQALARVDPRLAAPAAADDLLPRAARELRRFFAGEKADFDLPLDLSRCAQFTQRVLLAVAGIPYGATRSYGWVARRVGSPGAARAVGQVMARNPLAPVVPCHRVVGGNGDLVGFGGGLDAKRRLLAMEAAAAQASPPSIRPGATAAGARGRR